MTARVDGGRCLLTKKSLATFVTVLLIAGGTTACGDEGGGAGDMGDMEMPEEDE